MDPARQIPACIIEAGQLRERQDQVESFMRVARVGMEQLYKRVSSLGYVLLLADAEGIAVDYIAHDSLQDELKRNGLYLGSDWSELRAGTCGVGTCIVERTPVVCHGADHFDVSHIHLSCNSAPLFDPMGELLGILDVSSPHSNSSRDSQRLVLELTSLYAQMIENTNFLAHFGEHQILRLSLAWSAVDITSDLLVAFDGNGLVLGMNRNARRTLMAQDGAAAGACVGRPLSTLFADPWDRIGQIFHMGPYHDQAALRAHDGREYFASLIAPRPRKALRPEPSAPAADLPDELRTVARNDAVMQRLIQQAHRLANKPVNILVHGETGTGKEVLARAIHRSGPRRDRPFVAINCAAIPENLIESELFGYAPGTFTGGHAKGHVGLILQADGGTLFLDEIGDMPLLLQSRLLRSLSEREVTPLGSNLAVPVDLRVIAASHRDLRQLITQGLFREDLYYRLCGATLHLPALRDRADADYLLDLIARQEAVELGVAPDISLQARQILLSYPWPGNVRQLRNVLRFALAMSDDGLITPDALPIELFESSTAPAVLVGLASTAADAWPADARRLLDLLQQHRWHVPSVAKIMGVGRATIYRRMKQHGISPSSRQLNQD
jgi:transcriptional regulator of acetoin/glycerol metabolism